VEFELPGTDAIMFREGDRIVIEPVRKGGWRRCWILGGILERISQRLRTCRFIRRRFFDREAVYAGYECCF
jgi:hypothetical protein